MSNIAASQIVFVPKIYKFVGNKDNDVGSDFVLLEKASTSDSS